MVLIWSIWAHPTVNLCHRCPCSSQRLLNRHPRLRRISTRRSPQLLSTDVMQSSPSTRDVRAHMQVVPPLTLCVCAPKPEVRISGQHAGARKRVPDPSCCQQTRRQQQQACNMGAIWLDSRSFNHVAGAQTKSMLALVWQAALSLQDKLCLMRKAN